MSVSEIGGEESCGSGGSSSKEPQLLRSKGGFDPLVWEDPWENHGNHSVLLLPGESMDRSLVGKKETGTATVSNETVF